MRAGCLRLFLFAVIGLLLLSPASGHVTKAVLDNGMTVLVKEIPQVPVVALVAYVKVGSVNETESLSGISHFLEHMWFKGTKTRSAGDLAREVKSVGGYTNAGTGYERTSYVVIVPSRHVNVGLEVQADAMMHSVLDPTELESERNVVLEEARMSLDEPESFAWDKLLSLSFKRHGYRRPILGYEKTVSNITREHMLAHYKNYYKPNNIVLAVVGDVDSKAVVSRIEKLYSDFERGKVRRLEPEREPGQKSFRFASYSGDLERTYLQMGFHIPEELHEDTYAMEILSIILGRGRSSRLYQRVKEEKGLVSDVWTYCFTGEYPGLFIIGATLDSENLEEAEAAILTEIENLKAEPVSSDELRKARARVETGYERRRETVQGQAYSLAYYESLGDHRLADLYVENLYKVTREDIRKAANRYLNLGSCTLVFYKPGQEAISQEGMASDEVHSFLASRLPEKTEAREVLTPGVEKVVLKNGLTILVKENPSVPLVSVGAYFRGGVRYEDDDNNGITNFVPRILIKGTETLSQAQLAEELEALGGSLGPFSGEDYFGVSLSILTRNLRRGLEIFADILKNPSFLGEEVEKEREEILKEIRGRRDDLFSYTHDLFRKALFKVHPYKRPILGTEESVRNLRRSDLIDWYSSWLSPENMVIGVVGDFDSDVVIDSFEEYFGNLREKETKPPEILQEARPAQQTVLTEEFEKAQTHIVLGFLGPKVTDEDYYPFRVLNASLSGMGGRLWDSLREKKGLGYVVYSFVDSGVDPGGFGVYIGTSPDKEEIAIEGILDELRRVKKEGMSDEELARAKRYLVGIYEIRLQRNSSQVSAYLKNEIFGLGYQAVEEFPRKVEAVTKEDVDRVIKQYFDLDNYSLAVVRGKP